MTEGKDNLVDALPSRLKSARNRQGLSLDAIANLSSGSRSIVSRIERSESRPDNRSILEPGARL